MTVDWRGRSTVAIGLAVWVLAGWLLIAEAVAVMLPETASTPVAPVAGFVPLTGRTAHIKPPGIPGWPIPVDRRAYDEYYRGFQEGDDDAIDHALAAYEWIRVEHHQAVRIIEVDGEAHHVELLGRAARRSERRAPRLAEDPASRPVTLPARRAPLRR